VPDWHWEPVTDDLLEGLPPAALAAVRQVAEELTVRESMIFLDGRDIERRITDPTQLPTEMAVLPSDPREWQAWLSESAHRVASACSDDALDAPVFNPAGGQAARDAILDVQRPQRDGSPRL
jgi:hypothetical protein